MLSLFLDDDDRVLPPPLSMLDCFGTSSITLSADMTTLLPIFLRPLQVLTFKRGEQRTKRMSYPTRVSLRDRLADASRASREVWVCQRLDDVSFKDFSAGLLALFPSLLYLVQVLPGPSTVGPRTLI